MENLFWKRLRMAVQEMNCTILPAVFPINDTIVNLLVGINLVTSLSSIIVNSFFIAGITSSRSLMTPTNLLVGSLSLSDGLVGLITQPLFSAHLLVNRYETHSCILAYCSFLTLGTFCGASGLCLPIISLDRCIRMSKLSFYRAFVTRKRVLGVLCFVWVNALGLAFLPIYGVPQTVFYAILIAYLGIIIVIMTMSYICTIRRSRRKLIRVKPKRQDSKIFPSGSMNKVPATNELSRQMHVTLTVTYLIAVAIVSWLPGFVVSLIWSQGLPSSNENKIIVTSHYVLITFGFTASTINPLLYCWRIREVRKATIGVLRKVVKFN